MTETRNPKSPEEAGNTSLRTGAITSASARRVHDALAIHGLALRVLELPASTRTAREAAQAVGCQVSQIVKSLVFRGVRSGEAVLIVASGSNRVDEKKMAAYLGEPIDKPDAEFVRERTGFAIGGVPPVGHTRPLRIYIDRDLLQHDELWAAAGTPHSVFRLTPSELTLLTGGEVVQVG